MQLRIISLQEPNITLILLLIGFNGNGTILLNDTAVTSERRSAGKSMSCFTGSKIVQLELSHDVST
jgi:hypothetical protein